MYVYNGKEQKENENVTAQKMKSSILINNLYNNKTHKKKHLDKLRPVIQQHQPKGTTIKDKKEHEAWLKNILRR